MPQRRPFALRGSAPAPPPSSSPRLAPGRAPTGGSVGPTLADAEEGPSAAGLEGVGPRVQAVTEADAHVELEVVDHFIKKVNVNGLKLNHEQKKVNSKHQVTSDKFSSLLSSVGSAEELSSESTCTDLENQGEGLLLNGAFNEEESAMSLQEALIQWRKGSCDHTEELHATEVLSESVGIFEVRTNLTVMKEPIQIEFKKNGVSYMEKLLLKKYRRTPVDQISDSCIKDVRPVQTRSVHHVVTGEGGEDDDDVDDLTVEEVKRYWTSIFREEVTNTVSESAESSLRIQFLNESYGKDLEESSDFLVIEAGAMGMNKQGKTEPDGCLKKRIKLKTTRSSSKLSEKISNPTELMSNKYLLETQLQETNKYSQELDSVCNSQSLVLPVIRKSSVFRDVAKRKSVSVQYWGLEGFFVVGANPRQVIREAHSSLRADSRPVDGSILFPGGGEWVTERSLSEYAGDSVVQGVLESQLSRPSGGLEPQNRISPLMVAWRSYPGNDSRRPWLTNMLRFELTGNCSTNTRPRPKSSPVPVFTLDTEVSKHKCLDVTEQDEYLWERPADQEALLSLEKELESSTGSFHSDMTPDQACHRLTPLAPHSSLLLFNLESDPAENYDLLQSGAGPEVLRVLKEIELQKVLFEQRMEFGESHIRKGRDPALQPCCVPNCAPKPSCCRCS
ncbi:LOW QUALITY PROTEIN: zinc finger B-box domain-containing protein 1-like [Pterocles gutturalis]